jgi:dephospho-CoA kinase
LAPILYASLLSLAITGGIGGGKSSAGKLISSLGVPVLDTDSVARDLVSVGSSVLRQIQDAFGEQILFPDGTLDRRALASQVFGSKESLDRLEAILHPLIAAAWDGFLASMKDRGHPIAVVIIPLLYEKGYEVGFDQVIAVGCSAATQRKRLHERGWDDVHIEARMAAQMPAAEKMNRAHHVVWTEGAMETHRDQWRLLLDRWAICSRA